MINASITSNNEITLAGYGNDIDLLKALPSSLVVEPASVSTNFKTGRKHYIVILKENEDNSSDLLKKAENEILKLKKEVIKLRADNKKLSTKSEKPTEEVEPTDD